MGLFHLSLLAVLMLSFVACAKMDCVIMYSFQEFADEADITLFYILMRTNNCIYLLLPSEKKKTVENMRPREHNLVLPKCINNYIKTVFRKSMFI
jgi:hypothetical protein